MYAGSKFYLAEQAIVQKREIYNLFYILGLFGGLETGTSLILGPIVYHFAKKTFNYELVTKHMRVKRRNKQKCVVPRRPVDYTLSHSICKLANLSDIDKHLRAKYFYIWLPNCCLRSTQYTKNLLKYI